MCTRVEELEFNHFVVDTDGLIFASARDKAKRIYNSCVDNIFCHVISHTYEINVKMRSIQLAQKRMCSKLVSKINLCVYRHFYGKHYHCHFYKSHFDTNVIKMRTMINNFEEFIKNKRNKQILRVKVDKIFRNKCFPFFTDYIANFI